MIECPPECKKDLEHLRETDQRLEAENATQWDKIGEAIKCGKAALVEANARVRPMFVIAALGLVLTIVLAGFKLLYSQNTELRTSFIEVKERIVRVETKLDMFQVDHNYLFRKLERNQRKAGKDAGPSE